MAARAPAHKGIDPRLLLPALTTVAAAIIGIVPTTITAVKPAATTPVSCASEFSSYQGVFDGHPEASVLPSPLDSAAASCGVGSYFSQLRPKPTPTPSSTSTPTPSASATGTPVASPTSTTTTARSP